MGFPKQVPQACLSAEEKNQFSFNIVDHVGDRYLELKAAAWPKSLSSSGVNAPQVMNSNVMQDDSLGSLRLDTRSIEPGQWPLP